MSRSGRGSGKKPPDIGLQMECHDEPLTPEQQAAYNKGEQEYKDVSNKLEQMIKNLGAEIIEKNDNVYVMQMNTNPPASSPSTPTPAKTVSTPVSTRQSAALIAQPAPATNAMVQALQTQTGPVILQQAAPTIQTRSTVHTRTSAMRGNAASPVQPATKLNVVSPPTPTPTVPSLRIKTPKPPPAKPTPPPQNKGGPSTSNRPTEGNSVGGLSTGPGSKPWRPANSGSVNAPVVDLTDDDGKPSNTNVADSREVTFNKLSGKTFPSLVVVARPHLRIKDMAQSIVSQERAALGRRGCRGKHVSPETDAKSKSKRTKLKKQLRVKDEPQPQEERYVVEMVERHVRPGWRLRRRARDKHELTGMKQKKIRIIEPQAPPSLRLEKKVTKSRRRRLK